MQEGVFGRMASVWIMGVWIEWTCQALSRRVSSFEAQISNILHGIFCADVFVGCLCDRQTIVPGRWGARQVGGRVDDILFVPLCSQVVRQMLVWAVFAWAHGMSSMLACGITLKLIKFEPRGTPTTLIGFEPFGNPTNEFNILVSPNSCSVHQSSFRFSFWKSVAASSAWSSMSGFHGPGVSTIASQLMWPPNVWIFGWFVDQSPKVGWFVDQVSQGFKRVFDFTYIVEIHINFKMRHFSCAYFRRIHDLTRKHGCPTRLY